MSSKRNPQQWLRDILDAIEAIERYTAGMDGAVFRANPMAIDAVERRLQKVSEAAIRLGDDAAKLVPGQPWAEIRGLGNWLRHAYDRIDVETIWLTVKRDLPPLRANLPVGARS